MVNQTFQDLTRAEAKSYFESFLKETKAGFETLRDEMQVSKLDPNYSIESIIPVFTWAIKRFQYSPIEPDSTLPDWIRETAEYKKGLYEFDEKSKVLLLRISFYLGECFVCNYSNCSWDMCADKKNIYHNMPIVRGFLNQMELSPITVATNIVRNAIEEGSNSSLYTAIASWQSMAL